MARLIKRCLPCAWRLLVLALPALGTWAAPTPQTDPATMACHYQQGSSNVLIVASTLLLVDRVIDSGGLAIQPEGTIGQVGTFSELRIALPEASVLDCRGTTVLSPGWVNIHEHEAFSYAFPDPRLQPVYHHREEWILGKNGLPALPIPEEQVYNPANKTALALLASVELRHLMAGTTSLGGPGAVPGLIKNINRPASAAETKLYPLAADLEIFPFSMRAIDLFAETCARGRGTPPPLKIDSQPSLAFAPHLGEGRRTNCTAQSEIEAYITYLTHNRNSGRRYAAVHATAARPDQLMKFAEMDITLLWSPRSNLALYGETVNLAASQEAGVRMALGTDWSPSGSFNMLEEFSCAEKAGLSQGVDLTAHQLWLAATYNAAYAVGLENAVGRIGQGLAADLVLINRPRGMPAYQAAISAEVKDIRVVWLDGQPLIADRRLAHNLASEPHCVNLPATDKALCITVDALGVSWEEINALTTGFVPFNGDTEGQAPCNT